MFTALQQGQINKEFNFCEFTQLSERTLIYLFLQLTTFINVLNFTYIHWVIQLSFQAAAHSGLRGGFFERSMNRRSYCLPVDGSWLQRYTLAHMIPAAVSDSACSDQLAVAIRLTASTRGLSNQLFVEFTLNRTNRVPPTPRDHLCKCAQIARQTLSVYESLCKFFRRVSSLVQRCAMLSIPEVKTHLCAKQRPKVEARGTSEFAVSFVFSISERYLSISQLVSVLITVIPLVQLLFITALTDGSFTDLLPIMLKHVSLDVHHPDLSKFHWVIYLNAITSWSTSTSLDGASFASTGTGARFLRFSPSFSASVSGSAASALKRLSEQNLFFSFATESPGKTLNWISSQRKPYFFTAATSSAPSSSVQKWYDIWGGMNQTAKLRCGQLVGDIMQIMHTKYFDSNLLFWPQIAWLLVHVVEYRILQCTIIYSLKNKSILPNFIFVFQLQFKQIRHNYFLNSKFYFTFTIYFSIKQQLQSILSQYLPKL
ncbi:Hypothetical_protein [Hexamita inflata]|uniref:Hypothetical_protein n=1 Tax=Hexamita inflata TaxID=28002 RepID=A0AA86NBM4_9EUKA|nr:Hypothetical protein HINF_LOCUS3846 [Hexamita inflata]